jgi:hypothetical protein
MGFKNPELRRPVTLDLKQGRDKALNRAGLRRGMVQDFTFDGQRLITELTPVVGVVLQFRRRAAGAWTNSCCAHFYR